MKSTFTQGTVTHSTNTGAIDGLQTFLDDVNTGSNVNLHAPIDQMFQLAYAHRDTNYLLTVREGADVQAWGYYGSLGEENAPFVDGEGSGAASNTFYLFVDLNKSTGETSYGWAKDKYTVGSTAPNNNNPSSRKDGQHWFDTTVNVMKLWKANGIGPNYGIWIETVRSFVAEYNFNNTFTSLSNQLPLFIGTTTGLDAGPYSLGSLIFDLNDNVLKRTNGNNVTTFFTTEDIFASGLPTSSRTRIESFVVDGVTQEPVAAYQAVYFSKLNELLLLTTDTQDSSIFGIIETEGNTGELVNVTTSGVVNNSAWAWQDVNQQIFVDKDNPGVLTSVEDGYVVLPNQKPIAVAIDETTILLRSAELVLTTGANLTEFLQLNDTPAAYTGQDGRLVRVNGAEDALVFGAAFDNIDNVDAVPAVDGHAIMYVGGTTTWTARFLVEADITDLDKYTTSEVDVKLLTKSDVGHTHVEANITDLDKYTQSEVDSFLFLSLLSDVDFVGSPNNPINGDLLTYDAGSSKWQALAPPSNTSIHDADNDTFVEVELSADEDVIRLSTGDRNSPYPAVTNVVTVASSGIVIDLSSSIPPGGGESGDADGAPISITAGPAAGGSGYTGGIITITAGSGGADDNTPGGSLNLTSGAGGGGSGGYGGAAGDINITGANGATGLGGESFDGDGGNVLITSGDSGVAGDYTSNGGTIELIPGVGHGGGYDGVVKLGAASHVWPNTDGADGAVLTTDGGGNLSLDSLPYDVVFQGLGTLGTVVPTVVGELVAVRAFTVEQNGHQAFADISPTGSNAIFTVYHFDGTTKTAVGTVTFTTGGGTGSPSVDHFVSFSLSSSVAVAVGELLSLEMTTADSDDVMKDVTFTLLAATP